MWPARHGIRPAVEVASDTTEYVPFNLRPPRRDLEKKTSCSGHVHVRKGVPNPKRRS